MRKSLSASASAAPGSDLPASARAAMSAMTWSHALPSTAMAESTALLHLPRLPRKSKHAPSQHRVSMRTRLPIPAPPNRRRSIVPLLSAVHRAPAARPPPPLLLRLLLLLSSAAVSATTCLGIAAAVCRDTLVGVAAIAVAPIDHSIGLATAAGACMKSRSNHGRWPTALHPTA